MREDHLIVVDPAVETPADEAVEFIKGVSKIPVTLHQPALRGGGSLIEDTSSVRGILVLGSRVSVHDDLEWQDALIEWLMPMMRAGVPTLGICYGHQLIAQELGGRVGFRHPSREVLRDFRSVRFTKGGLWDGEAVEGLLAVSHREVVAEVPDSMKVIGISEMANDALRHESLPIWTMQPHPETTLRLFRGMGFEGELKPEAFSFGNSLVESFVRFVNG